VIKLDLGTIPEGSSHTDLSVDVSELDVTPEGGRLESPLEIGLDVKRTGNDIYLKGRAVVTAVLECARCLEEYAYVLDSPVEWWVIIGGPGGAPVSEERENVIDVPQGAKFVDLADHVRSELLVLVPLKPLCREECKGLCPRCGANLNETTCSCHIEKHDSRWDALKKIK
jgi:uncharacterized protein